MHLSSELRLWCIHVLQSNTFQQIAPLLVLVLVPTLVFLLASTAKRSRLFFSLAMGLDSLGINIPWFWNSGGAVGGASAGAGSGSGREKKKSKKHIRTRAEQMALNGTAKHDADKPSDTDDGYYPGLVNISGTYCFMNSTLQALASLTYLQPHIDAIHAKAEALDVPTPVIDCLQDLFRRLNTPRSSYHSIRPTDLIQVLTAQTSGRTNSLFYSREHQDAQELFQVLSECIKNEIGAVDKEGLRDRGLSALGGEMDGELVKEIGKSVFDGLTANRRSCVVCGYTEAVMHFALDNWQLAVPRMASSCRLEDCLEDYTRLEILKDCICRKCSILATHRRLQAEVRALEEVPHPSSSKKRRLKEVRRMEARVKAALQEGRIEDDMKDVRMEKVFSPASTKQAMIARPPPVLALHINRSVHSGSYASKNPIRLSFPEILDLTPYTTSGSLSTVPTDSISTPPPPPSPPYQRSTTPTINGIGAGSQRTVYRLAAVVCHYGQHSFGHYVCYRRKPRKGGREGGRWEPPRVVDPLSLSGKEREREREEEHQQESPYLFTDDDESPGPGTGRGWLRISDDAVREVGVESVLAEGSGAFMLYYERAVQERVAPGGERVYCPSSASEETLRPQVRVVEPGGGGEVGVGVRLREKEREKECEREREGDTRLSRSLTTGGSGLGFGGRGAQQGMGARVVRSVAAGRGAGRRSTSAAPSMSEDGGSVSSASPPESALGVGSTKAGGKKPLLPNGNAHEPHMRDAGVPESMTASAPSILASKSSSASTTSTSSSTSTHPRSKPPTSKPHPPPPPRIHSPGPKAHHASSSSVVGLKA